MEAIVHEGIPIVCERIRAKGAAVPYGQRVTWRAGYVSTAIFWCLGTGDPIGPDDGFVHPHVCVSPRPCFCDSGSTPDRSDTGER
jgi:hypothetical protein